MDLPSFKVFYFGNFNCRQEGIIIDADQFFDNFNGDADGWWLSPRGNWSIANGRRLLRQDHGANGSGADHVMGLVESLEFSDQLIETEVSTTGYGGVVFWYQDNMNYISVSAYPLSAGLMVYEVIDGVGSALHYNFRTSHNMWYDIGVKTDSATGELEIYVDDTYIFAYAASTPNRTGQSGVTSGNAGAYFDDFKITYNVCDADYNSDGVINGKDKRNKRRDLIKQAREEFKDWKENCYLPAKEAQE